MIHLRAQGFKTYTNGRSQKLGPRAVFVSTFIWIYRAADLRLRGTSELGDGRRSAAVSAPEHRVEVEA